MRRRAPGTLIIGSDGTTTWHSSRSIERNLLLSYSKALGSEFRCLAYRRGWVEEAPSRVSLLPPARALATKIAKLSPERLVFVSDAPHPGPLLAELRDRYGSGRALPELVIHVYGNFTLQLAHWLSFSDALGAFRIRFVCSSPKQAALLSQCLARPAGAVSVVPFPVDESVFRFDARARAEGRAQLGLSADERALLYTGRISMQKNTTVLLEEIAKLIEDGRGGLRFFLAGVFDEVAADAVGIRFPRGFFFPYWYEVYEGLPPSARERVHFLGNLAPGELNRLYNASDLFVSLSTHHDEDYGMAPAEALCTGLPTVLTDWGGYSSFEFDRCERVPVGMHQGVPASRSEEIQRKLEGFMRAPLMSEQERAELAKARAARLSCSYVSEVLPGVMKRRCERFGGFSRAAGEYGRRIPYGKVDRKFYDEFYRVYR